MEKQIAEVQKAGELLSKHLTITPYPTVYWTTHITESKLSKTKDGLMEEINKLQGHLLDSGTKQSKNNIKDTGKTLHGTLLRVQLIYTSV